MSMTPEERMVSVKRIFVFIESQLELEYGTAEYWHQVQCLAVGMLDLSTTGLYELAVKGEK